MEAIFVSPSCDTQNLDCSYLPKGCMEKETSRITHIEKKLNMNFTMTWEITTRLNELKSLTKTTFYKSLGEYYSFAHWCKAIGLYLGDILRNHLYESLALFAHGC